MAGTPRREGAAGGGCASDTPIDRGSEPAAAAAKRTEKLIAAAKRQKTHRDKLKKLEKEKLSKKP